MELARHRRFAPIYTSRFPSPAPVGRFVDWLLDVMAVHAERRRLAGMDDRLLKDIGITRSDAEREASRGAFDLPRRLSTGHRHETDACAR